MFYGCVLLKKILKPLICITFIIRGEKGKHIQTGKYRIMLIMKWPGDHSVFLPYSSPHESCIEHELFFSIHKFVLRNKRNSPKPNFTSSNKNKGKNPSTLYGESSLLLNENYTWFRRFIHEPNSTRAYCLVDTVLAAFLLTTSFDPKKKFFFKSNTLSRTP